MTFKYRYKKQIIIGLIVAVTLISLVGSSIYISFHLKEDNSIVETTLPKKKKKKIPPSEEMVKVDVKGAVNTPGIYTLKTISRVIDAIESAGGLREDADTSVINLSKKLIDEMVIIVYTKNEVKDFEKTKEKEVLLTERCNQKDENSLVNNACLESNTSQTFKKININTASKEDFMTLSGIGEKKAEDIITYRNSNGPFKTIEDLAKVPGIGEQTLASIKENLTI